MSQRFIAVLLLFLAHVSPTSGDYKVICGSWIRRVSKTFCLYYCIICKTKFDTLAWIVLYSPDTCSITCFWSSEETQGWPLKTIPLLMPLVVNIKEFVNFILRGVDLIDHTIIFLLRSTNHYVTFTTCMHYHDSFQPQLFRVFSISVLGYLRVGDALVGKKCTGAQGVS